MVDRSVKKTGLRYHKWNYDYNKRAILVNDYFTVRNGITVKYDKWEWKTIGVNRCKWTPKRLASYIIDKRVHLRSKVTSSDIKSWCRKESKGKQQNLYSKAYNSFDERLESFGFGVILGLSVLVKITRTFVVIILYVLFLAERQQSYIKNSDTLQGITRYSNPSTVL